MPVMGVLTKEETLMRKVKKLEYNAHIQKVSSFFRLAFHSSSNLRIYLHRPDFPEYPNGQRFTIIKLSSKQDMIDMAEYDERFDSIQLPILICIPEKEAKK